MARPRVGLGGFEPTHFLPGPLLRCVQIRWEIFCKRGGVPRFLSSFCRTTTTLIIHSSQQYRIRLWAKLLQLTDRRICMIVRIPVMEFKFKLQHISTMLTTMWSLWSGTISNRCTVMITMMITLKWRHITMMFDYCFKFLMSFIMFLCLYKCL